MRTYRVCCYLLVTLQRSSLADMICLVALIVLKDACVSKHHLLLLVKAALVTATSDVSPPHCP